MKLVRELGNERGQWWFTIEGTEAERQLVERTEMILAKTKLSFAYLYGGRPVTVWGHLGDGCPDHDGSMCISMGFHMEMEVSESFKEAYKAAKRQAVSELK